MIDLAMPAPPPSDLPERAWLAYLRQELAAPATTLQDTAARLHAAAHATPDPHTRTAADRIRERAESLVATVNKLAANEVSIDTDADRRTLRHDLRAAVGYVISACEDLAEGETAAALSPHLAETLQAAHRLLKLVASLATGGAGGAAGGIHDTLAKLPAAVAASAATADRSAPGRVLLVDDNEYNRDLVAKLLRAQGHTVEPLPGGAEAMARLTDPVQPPVDLVLCDVLMPGVTGIDLLRWLKADPKLWPIPVLMVSALGDDDGVLACIAAGAEEYLTRPVRPELLRARIAGSLETKRLRDREQENQARIDRLVRAIFPPAAVDEWRQHGAIRPRRYEKVGVLFADISGFTAWCEARRDDPEQVVHTLQDLIGRFEASAVRRGVQKIKTVGDAFMAAAGLSEADANPARTLLEFGWDVIADAAAHPAGWQVRVGVHVGPVVTGVLGETQFGFDVWGHTVNAAARMEANGRPGAVTLSGEAWADVNGDVAAAPRVAQVKGIGETTVWDAAPPAPPGG